MTFTYLTGSKAGSNGRMAAGGGSANGPGDPGGQVLVAQPGLAGPGEHLDVPRSGIAYVHHDRPGGRLGLAVGVRLVRRRRPSGGGQGWGRGGAYGGGGQTRGAGGRGSLEQGAPGQAASRRRRIRRTLRILTGHDDPFGGWLACAVARGPKATLDRVNRA